MRNKISMVSVVFLLVMLYCCASVLAQGSLQVNTDFTSYINGDGSSLEEAVIIKVDGLYPCNSGECVRRGFIKISAEEYKYLEKRFGEQGVSWNLEGKDNWEVDIERNDKLYDKVAIRILPSEEQKILYFDITVPVFILQGRNNP